MGKRDERDVDAELRANRKLVVDQREANQKLVEALLRAQDLAAEAEQAQLRAEAALARAEAYANRLQDSERELRVAGEFREQLLATVGHDLRNPLHAIAMAAAAMQAGGTDPTAALRLAGVVGLAARRMERMIGQLLEFTRARLGGGIRLQLGVVDLRLLRQEVITELEVAEHVTIQGQVRGNVTGQWDADRLSQVLSNLIGNAIEHADPGTPVVVDAYQDGPDAVVEVSNQGPAIPSQALPHLFDPFRSGRRPSGRLGHLGLGLFIANEIVRAHAGSLSVRSQGGTTTFTMRLPRIHLPEQPASSP